MSGTGNGMLTMAVDRYSVTIVETRLKRRQSTTASMPY